MLSVENRYDQKNEPTIFLPSGVHTEPKPKTNPKTHPNPKKSKLLSVYSAGQNYRWLIFLVVYIFPYFPMFIFIFGNY